MSLTTRLSAFFLAALAVVLVGFAAALYLLARAHLYGQADERLTAALDTLAVAAEDEPDGLEWDPRERHLTLGQDPGPEQVRWQIHDGQGRLVDRSANLASADLGAAGPESCRVLLDGRPWQVANRRLQTAAKSAVHPDRHAALVLTAGISLDPLEATLGRLALTLICLALGLWLAAALAGRWLCRRGLAPLTQMATTARGMDAADLGRRLPAPGTADELDDLGRAFNGLLDRLQEAFERQRRFTGDASHQLRTPLTAVLGQVEVALRRDRSAAEYRQALALVHDQAGQLRRIVEALLFLARADAEARLDALEEVDLAAWLPEHLKGWAAHARAADLRLEPPDGPTPVRVQPVLLGQLLDNLLDNACKYSEPGTAVTVSVQREAAAVALTVADAGRGIAAEDLPHVFEPFYRSASARAQGRAGVGLGLAVVRRIAATFGGEVIAVSTPGRGSHFTLHLPALLP